MINVNKSNCSGCSACACVCPQKCILMTQDEEGFIYPKVEKASCINCGKCTKVCPVINKKEIEEQDIPLAYLARTRDEKILKECTSGGVYTMIASQLVGDGGVAFGAVFDENYIVKHTAIESVDKIYEFSGSKYVQSDINDSFFKVKDVLNQGRKVVFCGTPCQVEGLVKFLGNKHDNLLLIDLVCHGVPSPLLWDSYVKYIEKRYGKHTYINFRSKKLGYHVAVMEERFESGKAIYGSARTNLMLKCYFKNIADRPICYDCPFKQLNRISDITLFDGWHASTYVDGLEDDDRGFTISLVHSKKGQDIMRKLQSHMDLYLVNTKKAIEIDGQMAVKSICLPDSRALFYQYLKEFGLKETVEKLVPIKKTDYLIEHTKSLLKKVGILQKIKTLRSAK